MERLKAGVVELKRKGLHSEEIVKRRGLTPLEHCSWQKDCHIEVELKSSGKEV